jgi:N,N'-diacetyllegionaminate synthase
MLKGRRPWIIAEIGVNHDGELETARRLIQAAARAGADAVKFQAFRAERLAGPDAPLADYQRRALGALSQREMLRALELDAGQLHRCRQEAQAQGLAFGCTPFDLESLRAVVALGLDFLKIGSGDADNLPLLEAACASGLPTIVSTGMCDSADVDRIVAVFAGAPQRLALLHCVSAYPAPLAECNLRVIPWLATRAGTAGFSDHTAGDEAATAAVALGAQVIERHLTHDRAAPGPDHAASLEEAELREYIARLRRLPGALGDGRKRPMPCEQDVRQVARKSLVAALDLPAGTRLERHHLDARRPAGGLPPWSIDSLCGRVLARNLRAGERLAAECLEEEGEA